MNGCEVLGVGCVLGGLELVDGFVPLVESLFVFPPGLQPVTKRPKQASITRSLFFFIGFSFYIRMFVIIVN